MSKGYRSRRMAVDFAVPLITNVKCAKLFVEALVRKSTFEISSVDYKTSHRTIVLPGLVALNAFVPGIAEVDSRDFAQTTAIAIRGGFSTIIPMPLGTSNTVEDALSLDVARTNATGYASCSYAMGVAASNSNTSRMTEEFVSTVSLLYIPFGSLVSTRLDLATVSAHFSTWPTDKPIVSNASGTDLASVLLLASLQTRAIHITNVSTAEDISIIALSKGKNLQVTCDVSVYALLLPSEAFPGNACLPSAKDRQALWSSLDVIDAFSIGSLPYQLAKHASQKGVIGSGLEDALPLLLTAVNEGQLTVEDITARMSDNIRTIFNLPTQSESYVEVEIDRKAIIPTTAWSPVSDKVLSGALHRVVIDGQTVFLDGKSMATATNGQDVSDVNAKIAARRKAPRFSITGSRPLLSSLSVSGAQFQDQMKSPTPAQNHVNAMALTKSPPQALIRSPQLRGVDATLQPSLVPVPDLSSSTSPAAGFFGPVTLATAVIPPLAIASVPAFFRRHILSVKQFARNDLHALFNLASEMRIQVERHQAIDLLRGRVLCTLFYEPSTRTSSSFETAMNRLGGKVVAIDAASSSVTKGESLTDTIRTLGCYGDAIVIRHPEAGSAQIAAKASPVPIINAGDGIGEHPTQVGSRLSETHSKSHHSLGPVGCLHYPRRAGYCQRLNHHQCVFFPNV